MTVSIFFKCLSFISQGLNYSLGPSLVYYINKNIARCAIIAFRNEYIRYIHSPPCFPGPDSTLLGGITEIPHGLI